MEVFPFLLTLILTQFLKFNYCQHSANNYLTTNIPYITLKNGKYETKNRIKNGEIEKKLLTNENGTNTWDTLYIKI